MREYSPLPPWVVMHVPHDSTLVPKCHRDQFCLDDEQLAAELVLMTDHHTLDLFCTGLSPEQVVRAPVSRLVVDVERFEDDDAEPMAAIGMGAVYSVTSSLAKLRGALGDGERQSLLESYYHPHHLALERAVAIALERFDRCLVIDCHSFPSTALPYERVASGQYQRRPDICIGTDRFHTNEAEERAFVTVFQRAGYDVAVNEPFSGALVPGSRYGKDSRVRAIMVEVSRHLYLDETTGDWSLTGKAFGSRLRAAIADAVDSLDLMS